MSSTSRKKLHLNELQVFPDAQRPLNEEWAQKIASDFNPDGLGTFIVSERKGKYYLIDGQTRKRALELVGRPTQMVDCLIHHGLTVQQEAELFLIYNESRNVRPIDKFRVRLTAKDPTAERITEICMEVNLEVAGGRPSSTRTTAVVALEHVFTGNVSRGLKTDDGEELLRETLGILHAAWKGEKDCFNGGLITGLAGFLIRHGREIDQKRFIRQLKKYNGGPTGFIRNAQAMKDIRRIPHVHAYASLFVDTYNKGMKQNHLPEWAR